MTEIWYTTTSNDVGYNLNETVVTNTPPNKNFKTYKIPAIWSNILIDYKDILVDSKTLNSKTPVFMCKNQGHLQNLIHTWNCSAEATVDYIDWE